MSKAKVNAMGAMLRVPRGDLLVGALGIACLVATLVPLVLISAYNHSYADDWHYGVWAHLVLQDTGNVFLAFVTALEQAGKAWFDWQGTYSAIFLMALEPSVFGEHAYVLAAPIVLATLVAGTLFFSRVALVELMGAERGLWLGVSCAAIAVQLLLQPSPVEGIFWFNSAIYYTAYNAAALVLLGCVLRICNPARARRPRGVVVASALLAAFVAGGNFVTALVAAEVLAAILVGLILRGRRSAVAVMPSFGLMVVGLAVSLAAPGNEVRQQTQFPEDAMGAWDTIWHSALSAFQYLQQWSSGLVLLLVVFAIPVALHVGQRAAARGWRFPLPGMVAVASVALFGTSFTPTFWAQSSVGPGRVQNCRFEMFVVLALVDVFWVCGWLMARERARRGEGGVVSAAASEGSPQAGGLAGASRPAVRDASQALRPVAAACGLAVLVAACVVGSMAADQNLGEELSSVSAARSLVSGQAAAYDAQVWSRLETIESSTESSLRVPFYTNVPRVLLMGDIRDNMDNYINYRLCQWYGKESIVGYHAPTTAAATAALTTGQSAETSGSGA